ncbi:MAG: tetratricopeptide repeat protein [Saprospiraceae bacterium]
MGKVIPYQDHRFKPLDYKKADDASVQAYTRQLNLFDAPKEDTTLLPLTNTAFDLALKLDLIHDPGAERLYLRAIEKNESTAHSLCNLGVIAAHKLNMVEAIDYFTRALIEDPRHCESHFNLANVFFAGGNYPLAVLHYQLVNRIAPDFADGYFNLGLTLLETENFKAAREAFLNYQKLLPDQKSEQILTILKSLSSLL